VISEGGGPGFGTWTPFNCGDLGKGNGFCERTQKRTPLEEPLGRVGGRRACWKGVRGLGGQENKNCSCPYQLKGQLDDFPENGKEEYIALETRLVDGGVVYAAGSGPREIVHQGNCEETLRIRKRGGKSSYGKNQKTAQTVRPYEEKEEKCGVEKSSEPLGLSSTGLIKEENLQTDRDGGGDPTAGCKAGERGEESIFVELKQGCYGTWKQMRSAWRRYGGDVLKGQICTTVFKFTPHSQCGRIGVRKDGQSEKGQGVVRGGRSVVLGPVVRQGGTGGMRGHTLYGKGIRQGK